MADAADWSNLGRDLLESIAKDLRMEDYIRLQAVCKPWRSVLKEGNFRFQPHSQLPWLAMPDDASDICSFYSFSKKNAHRVELPELRGRLCCGSSHGWMVVVDRTPMVFLLNPLTRSKIPLPPITTFPEILDYQVSEVGERYYYLGENICRSGEFMKAGFFKKVTLSANPSLTSDYVVMAIYGYSQRLAFCRGGDNSWTSVHSDSDSRFFTDVVYWMGHFYAVDSGGLLVVCDLGCPVAKMRVVVPDPHIGRRSSYLITSGDELFFVSRRVNSGFHRDILSDSDEDMVDYADDFDEDAGNGNEADDFDEDAGNGNEADENANDPDQDDNEDNDEGNDAKWFEQRGYTRIFEHETKKFRVFVFDKKRVIWVRVTSLKDRMLFVGNNFGLSLRANDFPECKADHIYFTDDYLEGYCVYNLGIIKDMYCGTDLGVYDMKSGEIELLPCCPQSTLSVWPPPFWATLCPY